MAIQLPDLKGRIYIDDSALDKVGDSTQRLGQKLSSTGAALTKGLTVPIVGAGAAGVKMAMDVDKGLREVNTLFGETGQAAETTFQELQDGTKALSNEIGIAQEVLTGGLYQAISAGVPKDNAFEFMEIAAKAAVAGVTDTETAVDGLTTTLNAFGLDASRTQDVADSMFTAVKGGKTTFEELSASLFQVAPAASAAGVEFTDVNAALASLTASGTPTSVATTQLRQAIVELTKDGTKAGDAFKEVSGKTFPEFVAEGGNLKEALDLLKEGAEGSGSSMLDMFGSVEAGQAALTLTGEASEKFGQELENQADSAGAAQTAFEEMEKSGARKLEKAMTRLKNSLIDVGNVLLPIVTKIVDFISKLANAFSNLNPAVQKIVVVIGGLLAALGPVLWIAGKMIGVFGKLSGLIAKLGAVWLKLSAAFSLTPLGAVILAIAALAAGLVYAWKNSEKFREIVTKAFEKVKDFLGPLIERFEDFIGVIKDGWGSVKAIFAGEDIASGTGNKIWDFMITVANQVKSIIDDLKAWWDETWPQFSEAVTHIWNVISTVTQTKWEIIKAVLQVAFEAIKLIFETALGILKGAWSLWGDDLIMILKGIWTVISGVVEGAMNVIAGIIKTVLAVINGDWGIAWEGIKQIVQGVWIAIQGAIQGSLEIIKGIIGAAWSFIKKITVDVWTAIWDFLFGGSVIPDIVNGFQEAWTRIKNIISEAWNFIKGIVRDAANAILSAITDAWSRAKSATADGWNAMKSAVSDGVNRILDLVRALPGQIVSALGDLSGLLVGAGRSILNGLWEGAKAVWNNNVLPWLRAKAKQIQDAKGPLTKDRKLLVPQGQAIIEGLLKGMKNIEPDMIRTLKGMTDRISETQVSVPDLVNRTAGLGDRIRGGVAQTLATSGPGMAGAAVVHNHTWNIEGVWDFSNPNEAYALGENIVRIIQRVERAKA